MSSNEFPQTNGFLQRLEEFIAAQRPNWPGWAAVALGSGIAFYFGLDVEPSLWLGPAATVLAMAVVIVLRRHPLLMVLGVGFVVAAIGFSVASWRTAWVQAPQLNRALYRAEVTGRVVEIELYPGSLRVTLDHLDISSNKTGRLTPDVLPQRVRIKLAKVTEPILMGDRLKLTADLQPPASPASPGAFDFRRQAYFERLGGVGFSLRAPVKMAASEVGSAPADGVFVWFDFLRLTIGRRIQAELPGATGAMAMALIVGNQTALRADEVQALRDSGLAHLTSISGLHIGLAAGIFFFGLRALLALVPPLALRFDIKKWAAVMALAGAFFYAGLAGMPIPTQRALVMTGVFFCAILLDRSPISMRVIAFAAIVVLLLAPEALIGASFQMSFAAVLGLIRAFDGSRTQFANLRRIGRDAPDFTGRIIGTVERAGIWLGTLMLTSLIASLMTAPYAAYHFDRLTLYGIAANMLAVPLTGFWVMPLAVLVLVSMPFGLEVWPLHAMGWGCDLIIAIAHWVADWPGAVVLIPVLPMFGLLVMSFGLIWLCLIIGRLKWLGVAMLGFGCLTPMMSRAPDILASGDGKLVAVMNAEGLYRFSSTRAAKIQAETWLRRNAQEKRLPFPKTAAIRSPLDRHEQRVGTVTAPTALLPSDGGDTCNIDWCRFNTRAGYVAVVLTEAGTASACHAARLIISLEPIETGCPSAERVIDFFDLWRHGTHAVWINGDGSYYIKQAANVGERPWALKRFPKPAQPVVTAPVGGGVNTDASARSDDPES